MCVRSKCGAAVVFIVTATRVIGATLAADKVIERAVRATGGANAVLTIRSTEISGSVVRRNDGKTGLYTELTAGPSQRLQEITFGQEVITKANNGVSGWRKAPSGLATLTGDDAMLTEAMAEARNCRFLACGSRPPRGQIAVEEAVGGRRAFRVEFIEGAVKHAIFFRRADGPNSSGELPGWRAFRRNQLRRLSRRRWGHGTG